CARGNWYYFDYW
nr:immunoglobulin heavy chain junction region [Mus musculus]